MQLRAQRRERVVKTCPAGNVVPVQRVVARDAHGIDAPAHRDLRQIVRARHRRQREQHAETVAEAGAHAALEDALLFLCLSASGHRVLGRQARPRWL